MKTPVEQFRGALRRGDAGAVRALLEQHGEVKAAVNAPILAFGGRPVMLARTNPPVLDVLLEYGADLNLKSDWWAGPFGILETDLTREQAAPLIARGAVVDIFAAAHLDMLERVRALVESAPALVHARGGDGKTPLHCARSVAVATYLIEHGADIDARDVDHESTPAQYLIREAPDVARLLVERGAWYDIFIAVGLRDRALVERCLEADREALDHRTWQGKYTTVHKGKPSTREEIGDHRGDIYRWVFEHNASAFEAGRLLGFDDVRQLLLQHATPAQQLLAACAAADRAAASAVVATHPAVVASLQPEQMRLIADKAHANDTAAVLLMLDLGFDARIPGPDDFEAVRWAAFHGNAEMTRALLRHDPPIGVPDRSYGGTPLDNCIYGAVHGWSCNSAATDYPQTIQLLIDAGERVRPEYLPTGKEDVDAVLRARLS